MKKFRPLTDEERGSKAPKVIAFQTRVGVLAMIDVATSPKRMTPEDALLCMTRIASELETRISALCKEHKLKRTLQ